MDTDTKARLDRVRDAARTLITERDWFRHQADLIDAALQALGVDVPNAARRPQPPSRPGKRIAYQSVTDYRTNTEIAEEILTQYGAAMDIRMLQTAFKKRGREMGYAAIASMCSKATAIGRLRRVGVGTYRAACPEHELTSHLGEMPTNAVDLPKEADDMIATVPAHMLTEQAGGRVNAITIDPTTGKREYAHEYHEEDDEHEGEGE